LSFSRVEQSSHRPESPKQLVEGVLSLVGKLLEKDEVTLNLEVEPELPMISCSAPQIQQVILNLIVNGRDALNERYPGYHPQKFLAVHLSRTPGDPGCIRFSVSDHGNGVPESIRDKLFHPFFTTKDPDKGTGLGLSICQTIAHEHGGRLSFESVPGEGTSFFLDVPACGSAGP